MPTDNELNWSNIHIGTHITALRKKRKWSSYRLSLESGISNSVLTRVEKGEREPKVNTLLKIIEGLGLSPAEFFGEFCLIKK